MIKRYIELTITTVKGLKLVTINKNTNHISMDASFMAQKLA